MATQNESLTFMWLTGALDNTISSICNKYYGTLLLRNVWLSWT